MFDSLKAVSSVVSLTYSFILDAVLENSFQLPGPTPSMLYSSVGREEELHRQRHSHMPIEEIKASFPEKGNMFYQKNSILLLSGPQALHQVCEVLLNNFLKITTILLKL